MTMSLKRDQRHDSLVRNGDECPGLAGGNVDRGEWVTKAKCREGDPDALFVRGAEQRKAAAICRHCPVLEHCRADALDNRVEFGVWGGLTERQRRALLRKNPEVENWASYLAAGGELSGI
ncbi:WhiB family transcriptional regulator [Corynebacterium halotolerans]|uniref:WhiB family transcriptional regulator n=1 Tax=Corynebacterium halotolerans TaxID=225326 RepID=UPI003CECD29C